MLLRCLTHALPRLTLAVLLPLCASCASPVAVAAPAPADLPTCLANLADDAGRTGLSGAAWRQWTKGIEADMSVLDLLDAQPEFKTPIWDYLAVLVDEQRVADGQAMLQQWAAVLAPIAKAQGVDAATVVAVWGVESDYGRSFGKRPLLNSLATLSCFGRRQAYFRGELFSLVRLIDRGDLRAEGLVGSWAGAFGHTQFMPSTYLRLAVDGDGDGRRDLVGSVPDALASTANFLVKAGWVSGQPWGVEVRVPDGLDSALVGRRAKRPQADWAARGVKLVDGRPLSAAGLTGELGLVAPAGLKGPAFLVTRNFDAIYGYNAAESYALAISHLSDRLRGGSPWQTAWPTDDTGLSRLERRALQTALAARGHPIGEVDGLLGTATRRAIQAEQKRLGWPEDGRAGQRLLKVLQTQPQPQPQPSNPS